MTGPPSLAFPGSRTLAGWWRELAPYRPRSLWVGHLLLHRVEALVRLQRPCRPDPFTRLVLQAVALEASATSPAGDLGPLERLDGRLHLGPQVLRQVLHGLEAEGLARPQADAPWALTPLGRQALERGEYPRPTHERRAFHFLASPPAPAGPDRPPPFLTLNSHGGTPWQAGEGWAFDPGILQACLRQPPEWKRQVGFPEEVSAILGSDPEADPARGEGFQPPPWQRVILDRPERLLAALVAAPTPEGERLLGFPVRQDGWVLQAGARAFSLGGNWREQFPGLGDELSPEVWRQAWQGWCQPRGIPAAEADACPVERRGERLRVTVPARLMARLRSTRSDALKGEAWVLAGEGRLRAAALLEVVEATPAGG